MEKRGGHLNQYSKPVESSPVPIHLLHQTHLQLLRFSAVAKLAKSCMFRSIGKIYPLLNAFTVRRSGILGVDQTKINERVAILLIIVPPEISMGQKQSFQDSSDKTKYIWNSEELIDGHSLWAFFSQAGTPSK